MLANKNLLRSLACLKEEIKDNTTNRPCTLCKAWNLIVRNYTGDNMSELLSRVEDRFVMEDYQLETIYDLAKALKIICK